MITTTSDAPLLLRLAAPLAWRSDRAIAQKLMGFAATEQGSALDMLRAAEREADPRLRRLFFKHGRDEARHAMRFREAARRVDPRAVARASEAGRAERQDLHERLGLMRFVAFVWLSERRAAKQFEVLAAHFARPAAAGSRAELARLFADIVKDERFHVSYSRAILDAWCADGREREVRRALRAVRVHGAWSAWRRAGRPFGTVLSGLVLGVVFVAAMPLFALVARLTRRPAAGWEPVRTELASLDDLRRQF